MISLPIRRVVSSIRNSLKGIAYRGFSQVNDKADSVGFLEDVLNFDPSEPDAQTSPRPSQYQYKQPELNTQGLERFLLSEPPDWMYNQKLFTLIIKFKKNNCFVNFTNEDGGVMFRATGRSSGAKLPGKRGVREGSINAIYRVKDMVYHCMYSKDQKSIDFFNKHNMANIRNGIHFKTSGLSYNKHNVVRAVSNAGFNIVKYTECTPLQQGGCRPRKPKRI